MRTVAARRPDDGIVRARPSRSVLSLMRWNTSLGQAAGACRTKVASLNLTVAGAVRRAGDRIIRKNTVSSMTRALIAPKPLTA
jgi:hypothetical protein